MLSKVCDHNRDMQTVCLTHRLAELYLTARLTQCYTCLRGLDTALAAHSLSTRCPAQDTA